MIPLAQSGNEIDLLDLARIIRQLLFDSASLADTVNRSKIPLVFTVGILGKLPITLPNGSIHMLGFGIDPEGTSLHPDFRTTLTRNQFAQHLIGRLEPHTVSVKDVIKYAANASGGVHHDPQPLKNYKIETALATAIKQNGISLITEQVRPIARVVLRGLHPLIEDVQRRN